MTFKPIEIKYARHGLGYRYYARIGKKTYHSPTRTELEFLLKNRGYKTKFKFI